MRLFIEMVVVFNDTGYVFHAAVVVFHTTALVSDAAEVGSDGTATGASGGVATVGSGRAAAVGSGVAGIMSDATLLTPDSTASASNVGVILFHGTENVLHVVVVGIVVELRLMISVLVDVEPL